MASCLGPTPRRGTVQTWNRGTVESGSGWLMETPGPIKMDDLGVPPFEETSIYNMMILYYIYRIIPQIGDVLYIRAF